MAVLHAAHPTASSALHVLYLPHVKGCHVPMDTRPSPQRSVRYSLIRNRIHVTRPLSITQSPDAHPAPDCYFLFALIQLP